MSRKAFLLLAVAWPVLLAVAEPALAGRRPSARVLLSEREYSWGTGEIDPDYGIPLVLRVVDRDSRPLDVRLEFRTKGRGYGGPRGWSPATTDVTLEGLASSPEGEFHEIRWMAPADLVLGTGGGRLGVRLRTTVLEPRGRKSKSKRIRLAVWGTISAEELHAAVEEDLAADGSLDGFVLFDARSEAAYREGHVPAARNVFLTDIERRGRKALHVARKTPLVFYCYGGT